MRKSKYIPITIILVCIVFWIGSVIRIEFQTWRYISEFSIPDSVPDGVVAMTGIGNLKVLSYSSESVQIYNFGRYGGTLYRYVRQNSEWQFESWGTIWAELGSADDFVWPYIYHSSEGKGLLLLLGIPVLLIAFISLCSKR